MEQPSRNHLKLALLIITFWAITMTDGSTFGNGYTWAPSLEEGLAQGLALNREIMLIFHKTTCSACLRLLPKFEGSKEIQDLSLSFVLVSIQNDEDPRLDKYAPDGYYTPRIFFLAPNGTVLYDVINSGGNEDFKYFYYEAEQIVSSMVKALTLA